MSFKTITDYDKIKEKNGKEEIMLDDIGKNIRNRHKELKMSQLQLANRTGYADRSSIAKIENGDVSIPFSKIEFFANALSCSSYKLIGTDNSLQASYDKAPTNIKRSIDELLKTYNIEKHQTRSCCI